MRVLFVSPNVPWPPDSGGRIRTAKLLQAVRGLAEVHLRAVLASPEDEAGREPLLAHSASVQLFPRSAPGPLSRWTMPKLQRWFLSEPLQVALAAELSAARFDLVHLDEMFLARALPRECGLPVVVHHHKLDTELYGQLPGAGELRSRFDLWKLRRLESEAARRYRHHILCSEEDSSSLRARHPGLDCSVVENGFDAEYFSPPAAPPPREPDTLLFLGTMSYGPNVDAARQFAREVLPRIRARRPSVVLEIAGGDPVAEVLALAAPGVRVLGALTDVRPSLARCSAMVAPLRIGGGSRIKLIEALGYATPVVSTSIGAQGLGFADREHLRIADGSAAFADAVVELLEDPKAALAMARRGRAHALEHYPWSARGKRLVACWEAAARAARARTGDQPASAMTSR
jgi:glycosyltransferase involved in cell wall biosynthesis